MLVVNIIVLNILSCWRFIICEYVIESFKLHFLTVLICRRVLSASIHILWGKISFIVILDIRLIEINIQFTRLMLIWRCLVITWFASLMSNTFEDSAIWVVWWRHSDLLNVHQDGSCDIFGHGIQILLYLDLAWVPQIHGFEIVSNFREGTTAVYKSRWVVLKVILLLAFLLQSTTHVIFTCLKALDNSVGGSSIV